MDARDDQALQNKGYDAFEARKSKVLEIMSARGNYPIPAPVAKQGLRAFESPVAAAFTFLSALDPEGPWTFVWQDFKGGWHVRAGEPANWSAEYFANYAAGIYENAYFNVNRAYDWLKGRAKEDDIGALRMFHVELDAYDKHGPAVNWSDPAVIAERKQACSQAVNEVHRRYKVCPAFVVWSGGGVHLYYRLKEVILLPDMRFCPRIGSKEFEQQPLDLQERQKTGRWQRAWYNGYVKAVNGALAEAFKTVAGELQLRLKVDGVHDVTRILRVPGSMSIPDAEKQAVGRVPAPVELMYQAKPGLAGYEGYGPEELASLLTAHGVDLAAVQLQSAEKAVAAPARGGNIPAFDGEADGTLASLKVQRVHHVLSHIPCGKRMPYQLGGKTHYSDDRETWVCVLQGVKDELGEAGRPVMKTWEGGWPRPQLQDQWDTFNKKGVGFGTVVEIARQFGYDTQKDPWLAKIRELENEGLADEAFAGVQGAEELNGRPVKYEWFGIHRVPVEGGCQQPTAGQYHGPEPLPEALLPVEPFDFDLLPSPLQPWAQDLHERMQCAPDFIGIALMITLGSVLGPKITIRPQRNSDWTVAANNYGFGIAPSGSMKTPPIEQVLGFVKRLEATKREEHAEALRDFNRKLKAAEAIKGAAERKIKGDACKDAALTIDDHVAILKAADDAAEEAGKQKPVQKRYITNSFTPASLIELLRQNPDGILVYRDELVALFESFEREDTAESRSVLIEAHSGLGSHTSDRIGRGFDLHVTLACASILGTVQPGVIAPFVRAAVSEGRGADGWLQRFQFMVWPDAPKEWKLIDRAADASLREQAFQVYKQLDQLLWMECAASCDCHEGAPVGRPHLHFDAEAQEVFNGWYTTLKTGLLGRELTPLDGHRSKYAKLVPSIALICHLAEGNRGAVGVEALNRAIRWAVYLESHARRIYGSGPTVVVRAAKAILAKARKGDLKPVEVAPFVRTDFPLR